MRAVGFGLALVVGLAGCDPSELPSKTSGTGGESGTTLPSTSGSGGITAVTGGGGAGGGGGGSGGAIPNAFEPHFGPVVETEGVHFSVWAPNASAATLEGTFPSSQVVMDAAGGGVWKVFVPGATPGNKYRFVFDSPSGTITRTDPYCRQLDADSYCFVVDPNAYTWKVPNFTRPGRAESIVYEMHVGSFAAEGGATTGTFNAARARLAELSELGINVVELMPVTSFGGKPNGWGYNPELYFAPKTSYGTREDLMALVDEAHSLGMAVWLDLVVNHYTGSKQAPLYCFDGLCTDNSGVHFFGPGDYQWTPWGPRLSYPTPEVTTMIHDAVDFWLLDMKGDGFRWDSTSNIRGVDGQGTTPGGKELLVDANLRTHALGAISTAEDLKGWDKLTIKAGDGGFGFDAQWDGFCWDVTGVLQVFDDNARDMGVIEKVLKGNYAGDGFARVLFTESHDTVGNDGARLPVKIDGVNPESVAARKRSMLGAALLLTSPGVPMLFMGQEFLATSGFTPAPDLLPSPTAKGLEVREFYKDLIGLRRNLTGDSQGLLGTGIDVFHRNDTAKVVAYRRHGNPGQDVIVVLNFKNKAYTQYDIGVSDSGPWKVRVNTDWAKYGADFPVGQSGEISAFSAPKDGKPFTLPLKLGAYAAMVLTH
ncbi:MAG: alpha amylase C-terminal domain-containing protein [Polyangiaceae bacterium]|nr:alpha amylase C-terminal domain-containing protein [Polyangiaceae bacterium]